MRILRRPTPLVVAVFVGLSIGAVIAAARATLFILAKQTAGRQRM